MSEENTEGQTTDGEQATENSGSDAAPSMTLEQALAALEAERANLAAERGKKEKAVQESKTLRERAKAAEASKSDEVASVQKTAEEKAAEILKQAEDRISKYTQRMIKAEVKAQAAELLQDPADASAFLDLSKYVADDGEIDSDAIKSDLAELVTNKPHLAKSKGPKSNPAQGASGNTPPKEAPITRDQLDKMNPEEIGKALAEGRLNGLLGVQ